MGMSRVVAVLTVAVLVVFSGVGEVVAQSTGTDPDSAWETSEVWHTATQVDIMTMAERYNAALDRGASPQVSGERVTLRVHSTAVGKGEAPSRQVYHFTIDGDGRIRDVGSGEHPRATVVFSTSRGTVSYLATAPNIVAAFGSVFGRLGDVAGTHVTEDGNVYLNDLPSGVILELTVEEEAGERPRLAVGGEGSEANASQVHLLDFRGERPVLLTLAVGDADGDGRPDVVVPGHDGEWAVQHVDAALVDGEPCNPCTLPMDPPAAITPPDDDCDDDAPVVSPDRLVRCDGSVVLGAGSDESYDPTEAVLFIATSREGMDLTNLGEPVVRGNDQTHQQTPTSRADRDGRDGAGQHTERVALRLATGGTDGHVTVLKAHAEPDGGLAVTEAIDICSREPATACLVDPTVSDVQSIPVTGDGGAALLYLVDPRPERIEPISAEGVGLVNGVKWAVVSFLRGLGLF